MLDRNKKLSLKRDVLVDLTNDDLRDVVGAAELLTTACQDTSNTICVSVKCLPTAECTYGSICG